MLAILDSLWYYIQADFGCDEAGGGHSAEFSPAFMGNFRGAVWLKAKRINEEKQRKPCPWNCADWLRKPRFGMGLCSGFMPGFI